MAWNTVWNTRMAGTQKISEDRKSAGSRVFTGFQAQKKTSVDVFRWWSGGAGGIWTPVRQYSAVGTTCVAVSI